MEKNVLYQQILKKNDWKSSLEFELIASTSFAGQTLEFFVLFFLLAASVPRRFASHQRLAVNKTSAKKMSPFLTGNLSIPLRYIIPMWPHKCFCLLPVTALYYLGAEQTRKPRLVFSSSSQIVWTPAPLDPPVHLPQGSISLRQAHRIRPRRDLLAHIHLKHARHSPASTLRSRAGWRHLWGLGGFPHDEMQWPNFSFLKLFPVRFQHRMLRFGNIFVIERENKCLWGSWSLQLSKPLPSPFFFTV